MTAALTTGLSFPDTLGFLSDNTGQSLCVCKWPLVTTADEKKGLLLSKLLTYPAPTSYPFPGQASCIMLACHSNSSSPTACSRQLSPMGKLFEQCQPVPRSLLKMVVGSRQLPLSD